MIRITDRYGQPPNRTYVKKPKVGNKKTLILPESGASEILMNEINKKSLHDLYDIVVPTAEELSNYACLINEEVKFPLIIDPDNDEYVYAKYSHELVPEYLNESLGEKVRNKKLDSEIKKL